MRPIQWSEGGPIWLCPYGVGRGTLTRMIYARIVSEYPADPVFTGWPAEVTDVVVPLDGFATNAIEAHQAIQRMVDAGEVFELPYPGETPLEFTPGLIRLVVVWSEGPPGGGACRGGNGPADPLAGPDSSDGGRDDGRE